MSKGGKYWGSDSEDSDIIKKIKKKVKSKSKSNVDCYKNIISKVKKGSRGPRGKTGPRGRDGCRGKRGYPGAVGLRGPTGSTGPTGETGPFGPTGPTGSTLSTAFIPLSSGTTLSLTYTDDTEAPVNVGAVIAYGDGETLSVLGMTSDGSLSFVTGNANYAFSFPGAGQFDKLIMNIITIESENEGIGVTLSAGIYPVTAPDFVGFTAAIEGSTSFELGSGQTFSIYGESTEPIVVGQSYVLVIKIDGSEDDIDSLAISISGGLTVKLED
jgi:Collagen triple helix repeat (20 copies).